MLLQEGLIRESTARYNSGKISTARPAGAPVDGSRAKIFREGRRRDFYRRLLESNNDPRQATQTLERIIAGNDLVGIRYLALGTRASHSVGRVHLRDDRGTVVGYGTGFLVAPGVMMTNNHVIGSDLSARTAQIELDYEYDIDGRDRPSVKFALEVETGLITDRKLDFTLVGVTASSIDGAASLASYGWLPLNPRPGKSFEGEYLTIIQHPSGERKQICVRENKLLKYGDDTIWYETDTVAGSSGSPVFNGFWDVVALHHSGIPETDARGRYVAIDGRPWDSSMDESRIKWKANEGIRISRICEFLRLNHADAALARRVLSAGAKPAPRVTEGTGLSAPAAGEASYANGAVTLRIPVTLSFKMDVAPLGGVGINANAIVPGDVDDAGPAIDGDASPLGVEKVVIDQSNYAERKGYDPEFLGTGKLEVSLPRLTEAMKKQAVKLTKNAQGDPALLRYHNYSLMMNGPRRLAFYSAVNIDGPQRRDSGKREGDKWFADPRIPEKFQIGDDFYASVRLSEAARVRVFDRGHLVRRLDATWGPTAAEAKRNGDDTFHFTNCSPQHWKFNEGTKLWAGIEDYVLFAVENDQRRACVISGPVFARNDEKVQGVAIPKQFFKIAVFVKDNRLVAAGFLLSQADLLTQDLPADELRPLPQDEAAAFQVKISKIATLTKLNFGDLVQHDAAMAAFEARRAVTPLRNLGDIAL